MWIILFDHSFHFNEKWVNIEATMDETQCIQFVQYSLMHTSHLNMLIFFHQDQCIIPWEMSVKQTSHVHPQESRKWKKKKILDPCQKLMRSIYRADPPSKFRGNLFRGFCVLLPTSRLAIQRTRVKTSMMQYLLASVPNQHVLWHLESDTCGRSGRPCSTTPLHYIALGHISMNCAALTVT